MPFLIVSEYLLSDRKSQPSCLQGSIIELFSVFVVEKQREPERNVFKFALLRIRKQGHGL